MEENGMTQFERQLALPHMSPHKQEQLMQAKVVVVGAGGLGCAVLDSLVRAGVQHITVFDGDTVALSNLHRQSLYGFTDLGLNKAVQAVSFLQHQLKATTLKAIPEFLNETRAKQTFPEADIIIDCSDQIDVRMVIDRVCKELEKPWIYASVHGYETQLAVFRPHEIGYQALFQGLHHNTSACNDQGVWGMIPNILGYWQALEAVKLICHLPGQLQGELVHMNFLHHQQYAIRYAPKIEASFTKEATKTYPEDLTEQAINELLQTLKCRLIDVRQFHEKPDSPWPAERIPMDCLFDEVAMWSRETPIIFICHSGYRSRIALETLKEEYQFTDVYHLKGGIVQLKH